MQFVRQGPDIPERLLQAHEDGRVVFFCGAGISYPARLPGFAGLVAKLYEALAATPNAVQQAAIKAGQFDTAIGLLEADIVGGRETVRRALAGILTPDLSAPNATATHEALLTLSKCRNGNIRLITTNFDRLFEEVIAVKSLPINQFQAPLLPVPKNRWDGLVYLHGLLGTKPSACELDRLVVSSGDFGLAYLTERWAARFVSELLRNYTVCFVGYSINDPVLRYMMDALAADRLLGESTPEMFAFGSFAKGKEEERSNEWRAKNVTPILYREHNRHAYLHKTLRAWAETYRDGVRGKERIVAECAMARPLASTRQDDFVGRLLWALSDPGGLPARLFADLDPVPSLDWLEPLSEERYRHADLGRFGVPPRPIVDETLTFSLARRPSPYPLAPPMCIVDAGACGSRWDEVMRQLARWLTRHLNNPELLLWLVKRGGQLHDDLV
ncbi:TPA: SIR2 family protein, partial [Pseudomonas aeruginosa]|nr:SIR2 family protein [Pseudomonas aeruginosa]